MPCINKCNNGIVRTKKVIACSTCNGATKEKPCKKECKDGYIEKEVEELCGFCLGL